MLTTTDYVIIGVFAFLLLLYKVARDWYGVRDVPRKIDEQAAEFLREEGYRVQARAAVKFVDFNYSGKNHRQKVKADLVVRRGLKRYVVEVNAKDGGSLRDADARRRFLEYKIAFAPTGVMSLDMDRERIRIVSINNRRRLYRSLALTIAVFFGAALYLILRATP